MLDKKRAGKVSLERFRETSSNGQPAGFARADPDAFLQRDDENFTVADTAGARAPDDGFQRGFDVVVVHGDFETHPVEEVPVGDYSVAGIGFADLRATADYRGNGYFAHVYVAQSLFDVFDLVGLYDGDDQFHQHLPFKNGADG